MSFAKINWSIKNDRYEMKIDGKLKAHTGKASKPSEHEAGLEYMKNLAEGKGYTVHIEKN